MTRLRTRPTPVVLAALIVLVVAAGVVFASRQADASTTVVVLLGTIGAAGALLVSPWVHPAVPIGLGLLLSVFSGNWTYLGVPLGLDRPLVVYGIVLALLRTLPDARVRWRLRVTPVHGLMVVVGAYGVGSAIAGGTFGRSDATFALSERLGIFGFFLFLVAPRAFATERARNLLLTGFVVLGAYMGLTAVLEGVGLDQLVFPRYIVNPAIGITAERARGPFVESGSFGLALFTCAAMASVAFVRWRRPLARAVCVAVVLACTLGVVFTLTRQAWLGAVVGTPVAMLATPALRRLIIPTAVAGVCLVAVALAVVPGLRQSVDDRAGTNLSVYDRLNSNRAAVKMVEDRPVLGFGWYTFADTSLPFLEQSPNYPLRSVPIAHNVFLGFASELGLLGTGLWLLALVIVVGTAIIGRAPPDLEPWRIAVIAVTADWFVVANLAPTGSAFTSSVLWLLPGIVWAGLPRHAVLRRIAAARSARGRGFAPLPAGPRLGLLAATTAAGAAVGLALGQVRAPTYLATTQLSVGGVVERSYDFPFADAGYERWASTYGRVGLSDRVLVPAARELGISADALRRTTVVTPLLDQPVVSVRVRAHSPSRARAGADAVATSLRRTVRDVVRQEPELRRLKASFAAAGRVEAERIEAVRRAANRVGQLGKPASELTAAEIRPLNRAQAEQQAATLRRIGFGVRYTALATTDRASLELQADDATRSGGSDRWSVAGLWACGGAALGLIIGASAGIFPPRRRARAERRPTRRAASASG